MGHPRGLALGALLAASAPAAAAESDGETQPLTLEALDDIVVTATLREQSTLDAPASITVVSASEIRLRGYRTLKQIMNDVPGFNDVSDVNEEIAAVRGVFTSTTNKILILVNGHRMNDLVLGRYNTDQYLGMHAVDRVEFIRGPASALYGTGALVGVVNVITRKGADLEGSEARLQGGPFAQEASFDWGKQIGGYDVFFDFTYLDATGQEIAQDASVDVAPPDQVKQPGHVYVGRYPDNLSALLTVRSDSSELTMRAAHFRRAPPRGQNGSLYDYPREPYKPSYTENDFFIDYAHHWTFGPSGSTRLTVNPSVHYFSYYEQSFITFGANRFPPLGERSGTQTEFHHYQLKVTAEQQLGERLNVIAGFDGLLARFYRSDAVMIVDHDHVVLTPEGYTPTGRWFLGGGFLQAVWSPWKVLSLTVGARYDTFQGEAHPELTPRVGVVYKPIDPLAVKLLYGHSYLAPMWGHKRAHDGSFVGNPDVGPESFDGVDLVAAYGYKQAIASVDFFANKVDGLINSVQQTLPSGNTQFSYQNTGESLYVGVDASGEAQLLRRLRLVGSYSFIRPGWGSDTTTSSLLVGTQIKDIARHTFRYGLRVEPLANLTLSLWGRIYAVTRTADKVTGADTIAAVALLDASLTYDWRRFTVQVIGTNLTDRSYERGGTVARPLARERLNVEGAVAVRF